MYWYTSENVVLAVRDPAQEDHELQQVGARLLPEGLLRVPEQVVVTVPGSPACW
jgi:hypothetical protein